MNNVESIADISRGLGMTGATTKSPGIWNSLISQIVYYQYVVKRGLHAPWTLKAKQAYDASGGEQRPIRNSQSDLPSWGDLLWAYPGRGEFKNNDDRTIWAGGKISLRRAC
ncbi:hypothetical protein BKA61DRAFT_573556 [Leptodontidium sp. MPI-SDFR-AT-0119]|nr:hypothetical protein BKA61DRAFT_573556 [Leptodontidium sp. MPI-SDFR-AT-0119]